MKQKIKAILKNSSIVVISLIIVYLAIQAISYVTYAGNLNPNNPPSATMTNLTEMYDIIAGDFDSSSIVADPDGNAFQVVKCIISKINTGTCP